MNRLLVAVALTACGGPRPGARVARAPAPAAASARRDAAVDAARDAGAGAGKARPEDGRAAPLACDALLAHLLALEVAERPPEQRLDASEHARVLEALRLAHADGCRELTAARYRCAMAATRTAAVHACEAR